MSTIDKSDPAPKHAPSIYSKLVHAEESEILSWAVKTCDLGPRDRDSSR